MYAGTLTSGLGIFGVPFPTGDNGAVVEAGRQVLNDFIRTSGLFDGSRSSTPPRSTRPPGR